MTHPVHKHSNQYKMLNIIIGWILIVLGVSLIILGLLEWIRFRVTPYFSIVGLALTGLGILALKFQRMDSRSRAVIRGSQSWLKVPIWQDGKIPSQKEYRVQFFCVASIIFLVFFPIIFFFLQESVFKLIHGIINLQLILEADLLLALLLMTGSFLVMAIYYILENRKFSDIYVVTEPFPATTGKDLACKIELPIRHKGYFAFYGVLTCFEYRKLGTRHIPRALWNQKATGDQTIISERITKIKMAFSVPDKLPESSILAAMADTDLTGEDEFYVWKLVVKSKGLHPNLSRAFILPVFTP